jgi:hypothetical protein
MMYKRLTADRRDIGLRYAPRPRGDAREGTDEAAPNLAAPRHAPRARHQMLHQCGSSPRTQSRILPGTPPRREKGDPLTLDPDLT